MRDRSKLDVMVAGIGRKRALLDDVVGVADRLTVGVAYPRLFSDLLRLHAFAAFDVGGVRVHGNVRGGQDSLEALLQDAFLTRTLCDAGFAPFGRPDTGSYDRVCFDMRKAVPSGDAPVVRMDHEAILSFGRLLEPAVPAGGIVHLFEMDALGGEARVRED